MSNDSVVLTAKTNTTPNSVVVHNLSCNAMWSLAQQFCYVRITKNPYQFKGAKQLIDRAPIRARVIAATYARLYLEQEESGDPDKKGRFYWAALAAFASKTVACTLENTRVNAQYAFLTKKVKIALAKGNLWLFYDIGAWHHYYTRYGDCFDFCLLKRNSNSLNDELKAATKVMPWSEEVLPKIGFFKRTPAVEEGFRLVKNFETTTDRKLRPQIQWKHLLEIAKHEQNNVLQPLIYSAENQDSKDFVDWIRWQREYKVLNWIAPTMKLVFGRACDTSDPELESVAPQGTKLEEYQSRMDWITKAAERFHKLMLKSPDYMEAELQSIASWVTLGQQAELTEDLMNRSIYPKAP
jgi:hypothetical protein